MDLDLRSPAALLATWVIDRQDIEHYADDAPPVTDDQPGIEYAGWLRRGEFQRVLPRVVKLRTEPPLRQADEAFQTEVASERDRLLGFYEAGLYAFAGVRERWASHYVASLLKTGATRIIVRLSRNNRRRGE